MTYDPTAAYRTAQVTTSSPAHQVVLLYEGAIRFCAQSIQRLAARDLEGAHTASIRAQAIVAALRETLDMDRGGDIAVQLDALYDFMLRRLVAGNVGKQPGPVLEVIDLLRGLLEAWRAIETNEVPQARPAVPGPPPRPVMAVPVTATGIGSLVGAIRA